MIVLFVKRPVRAAWKRSAAATICAVERVVEDVVCAVVSSAVVADVDQIATRSVVDDVSKSVANVGRVRPAM